MRVRVKICGITRAADAECAAEAGADAIGLVFHAASPRALRPVAARAVIGGLAPFVTTVALFVDPSQAQVREVLDAVRPDVLQFHGAEDEPFCVQFGVPYIKALRVPPGGLAAGSADRFASARGLLLDTWDPSQAGGTGRAFDWSLAGNMGGRRLVLAGGLNAANVALAIRQLRPFAVDVSSGVESAPGIKDPRRIREFIRAVREVDATPSDQETQGDELA